MSRSAQGMASRAVTRKTWCCLGKAAELLKGGSAESLNLGPLVQNTVAGTYNRQLPTLLSSVDNKYPPLYVVHAHSSRAAT